MNSTGTINVAFCQDNGLKEICSEYSDTLPRCGVITPREKRFRDRSKVLWGKINCVDLFELKNELLKTKHFKFKATSWCMFPVLKKGDILKITSAKIDDIKIGDIPVYRSQGKLYAHRVVDKQVIDGKQFTITRADQSGDLGNSKNGEKVSEENILGKIVEVKRGRKTLSPEKRYTAVWEKVLFKEKKLSLKSRALLKKMLEAILPKIQSFKLYQVFGKKALAKMKSHLNFVLAVPFSNQRLNQLYIYSPLQKNKNVDFPKLKKSKIFHLVMKFNNTPVGCATILNRPDSCPYKGFWIANVYIRLRYRGLGLRPILLKKAEEISNGIGKYKNFPNH